ncbi:MAG TPA: M23 family metallopeptidase [Cyclobacteriaceae bacterium]|nr:M23 family metallopeptidase [Cyclobacteriaceae bacterium]
MKLSSVVFLLCFACSVHAQFSKTDSKVIREEKFLFPLKPGQPGSLAGTMGELRNTHFHTGIDIRTNNEIGWPVLASKSGYISRAAVTPSGFGNVLYVTHPDGTTTLYGHLDRFNGAIEKHILNTRYTKKASDVDLNFQEGQFNVKQGDTIAFAGNTGSSGGPHLHFDIRRSNQALDPLKFEFTEINDVNPPIVQKIALKTLDIDSRINDRFGRVEFYATRVGKNYSLPVPILASGNIGIELLGYDRVDNARYKCGINYIEVFVDSVKIFSQKIEELNLLESRSIYTFIDYKTLRNQGNRFYKLYVDDGNKLNFYNGSPGTGQIKINPDKISNVLIVMKDIYGNTSQATLRLKPSAPVKQVALLESARVPVAYDIQENTLAITTQACAGTKPVAWFSGTSKEIEPTYFSKGKSVFLFDLRKEIPDSVNVCGQSLIPNIKAVIPAGTQYKYYSVPLDVQFPRNALFDTLYFNAGHRLTLDSAEIFTIGNPFVPLNRNVTITLRPNLNYSTAKNVGVYRIVGKRYSYEGGRWVNGSINFTTREFGNFTILTDSIPPAIRFIYANNQAVRFKIDDQLSGIADFEATINGKWLLMNYDAKNDIIMSERRSKTELLKGDLVLTVTDNAGNKRTFNYKIP